MDELSVIVEGVGNKVKKLIIRNNQLKDKMLELESEKISLQEKIRVQSTQIQQLESRLADMQLGRVLGSDKPLLARQKINELLREIEKCQALLNK